MKPVASIHSLRSDRKVLAIVQDTSHPANHLFYAPSLWTQIQSHEG